MNKLTIQEVLLKNGSNEFLLESDKANVRGRLYDYTTTVSTSGIELTREDSPLQLIDPDGADINVTLPSGWVNNDTFLIKNVGASGTVSPEDGVGVIETLYPNDSITISNVSGDTRVIGYASSFNQQDDVISLDAEGTPYTITTTLSGVAFGTTSPIITLDKPGFWYISANITVDADDMTSNSQETITLALRRTNNTPETIGEGRTIAIDNIYTNADRTIAIAKIEEFYETANDDDVLQIFADITDDPNSGGVIISAVNMRAIRIN